MSKPQLHNGVFQPHPDGSENGLVGLHRSDGSNHPGASFEFRIALNTTPPSGPVKSGRFLLEGDVDAIKAQIGHMIDAMYDCDRNWLTPEEREAWLVGLHGPDFREREAAHMKTLEVGVK